MKKTPRPGTVVEVYLNSPGGKPIDHIHPAVVLVVHQDAEKCEVIAISTKLHMGVTDYHVPMPYGKDAKSGLRSECVAKPEWHDTVLVDDCTSIGFISTEKFAEIKASFARFREDRENISNRKDLQ